MNARRWTRAQMMRLRALVAGRRLDRELDEELDQHLAEKTRHYIAAGLRASDARRQAARDLDGMTRTRERCHDARGIGAIEMLAQDLRYGARTLRANPGFTTIGVLTLALGIGANAAMFSLVDGLLLRPLPYPQPERLVRVLGSYPKGAVSAMRDEIRSMTVGAYAANHELNLIENGTAARVTGTRVSAELFAILGARPLLGRTFASGEDDPGRDRLAIIGHATWVRRFARDPGIVGRHITLDGVSREVVGVMPPGFEFPSNATELWVPFHNDPRDRVSYWAGDFMPAIGRLRPGTTLEQAAEEIRGFHPRVRQRFPWRMPAGWNRDAGVVPLQADLYAGVRGRLFLLVGAVALVLLIACANVANLLLARAGVREKEMVIRAALGAGRRRIARQLITESLLLAILGGVAGCLLAWQGLPLLKAALPADTPGVSNVYLDWRALAATAAITMLTGLLFGLAPAIHAARAGLADRLKAGNRSGGSTIRHRARSLLVVGEIAGAVLLVTAAGLLIRSFWSLSRVDPGFRTERILTARLTPADQFCREPERCLAFYDTVLARIRALPGVVGAALVNTPPLDGRVSKRSLEIDGRTVPAAEAAPLFWLHAITADYFRVMDIRLLAGRPFNEGEAHGHPLVAAVPLATATRFWPGQDALGKRIRFVGERDWRTVVAVVSDVRAFDLQRDQPAFIAGVLYVPYSLTSTLEDGRVPSAMTVAIGTAASDLQDGATLRRLVAGVNADVPISDPRPFRAALADAVAAPASAAGVAGAFAAVALALGLIGVYGVTSFLVANRTREIAIRVALGARRPSVLWLVLREGATLSAIGIGAGAAAAFGTARFLAAELYGVSPIDPPTYAAVAILVAAATLLACAIPTRRAMRVDPAEALRNEQ